MGNMDIPLKGYFADGERFADLVNGAVLHGRQILQAEDLEEVSPSHSKADGDTVTERQSDVAVKQLKNGSRIALFLLENQTQTDYGMPVRVFYNEALEYDKQYRKKQKENRARWKENGTTVSGEEFLSGLCTGELLIPVITLVLYWGDKKWSGPTYLKELLQVSELNEELQAYVSDYHINLIHIDDLKNHEYFKTDLKHMVALNQCKHSPKQYRNYVMEHEEAFASMDAETCYAISRVCDSKELLKHIGRKEQNNNQIGKEHVNMCKALEGIKEEGREEGRQEGILAMIRDNLDAKISPENITAKLQKYFNLDAETANNYIQHYL